MKKILTAALALTIAGTAATAASAQAYHRYDGPSRYDRDHRYEQRYDRREARREDRREARREYRQHQRWARGQHMPYQYRQSRYVVNDYHRYRLAPPPRGYQYVRDGDDVVLAAIATGLIALVIAGAMN